MVLYWIGPSCQISTLYLTKIICSTIWIEVPLQWTEKEVFGDTYWGGVGAGANSSEPEKTRLSFELRFFNFWCFSNLSKTLNMIFLDIKHGNPGIEQGESNDWLIDEEIEKGIQYNTCPCLCLDRNK